MVSNDFNMSYYPNNEISRKIIANNREKIISYRIPQEMNMIFGYKPHENLNVLEKFWEINLKELNSNVLAFRDSRSEYGPRNNEFTISNKKFKKYPQKILSLMTTNPETETIAMHIIDPYTGEILHTNAISDDSFDRNPILDVYDNAVLVTIPKENQDEIIMIEMFLAQEVMDTTTETKANQASLKKLIYPVITNIKVDWNIQGMRLLRKDNV